MGEVEKGVRGGEEKVSEDTVAGLDVFSMKFDLVLSMLELDAVELAVLRLEVEFVFLSLVLVK